MAEEIIARRRAFLLKAPTIIEPGDLDQGKSIEPTPAAIPARPRRRKGTTK